MVTGTLRLNQTIPTEAEIEMMIKDPMKWVQDYRVGTNIRQPDSNVNQRLFCFKPILTVTVQLRCG